MPPPTKAPPRARDLARALDYRPRDIYELHGIASSTLADLATHADPARRPISRFIRGRGGKKGIRLFPVAAFHVWLACWAADGRFLRPEWQAYLAEHYPALLKAA